MEEMALATSKKNKETNIKDKLIIRNGCIENYIRRLGCTAILCQKT